MKNIVKSRAFIFFVLFCFIGSVILIVFNLSQVQKYQLNKRNQKREHDIATIIAGIKSYISNTNNLPTTSNPAEKSFLPELIFQGNNPLGGVSINTLENMKGYNLDIDIKDPSGAPYFVGTSGDNIVVYTNSFERYKSNSEVYYKLFQVIPSGEGKVITKE